MSSPTPPPLWQGYRRIAVVQGLLIYGLGDAAAAWILGEWTWHRMLGVMILGGAWYSIEIPTWFRWIDRVTAHRPPRVALVLRMLLAAAWFNPLWIARHLLVLQLVSGHADRVSPALLGTALHSFLVNLPFSLLANFLIQNVVALRHRFLASSSYSALTAVYYALSARWFG